MYEFPEDFKTLTQDECRELRTNEKRTRLRQELYDLFKVAIFEDKDYFEYLIIENLHESIDFKDDKLVISWIPSDITDLMNIMPELLKRFHRVVSFGGVVGSIEEHTITLDGSMKANHSTYRFYFKK